MTNRSTQLLMTDARRSVFGIPGCPSIAYSPHGVRRRACAMPALGFTGQRVEPILGVYLLGHGYRVYSPVLMRFHKPDVFSPFAEGGLNTYAYCQGDPVNFTDASGRFLDLLFPQLDPKVVALLSIMTGAIVGTANVVGGVKTFHPNASVALTPLAKRGLNTALVGSLAMVIGGSLQLAGEPEGRYVSAFGSLMTFAGSAMAVTAGVRFIKKQPDPWGYVWKGVKARVGFKVNWHLDRLNFSFLGQMPRAPFSSSVSEIRKGQFA